MCVYFWKYNEKQIKANHVSLKMIFHGSTWDQAIVENYINLNNIELNSSCSISNELYNYRLHYIHISITHIKRCPNYDNCWFQQFPSINI